MQVELGNDATYLVARIGSISFQIPLGDILELTSVLYVLGFAKNFILVLVMIDLGYMVEFDGQQDLILKRCLDLGGELVRGI